VLPAAPNVVRAKFDRVFAEAGLAPHIAAEVDVMAGSLSAVSAGIGRRHTPKGDFSDLPGYGNLLTTLIRSAHPVDASVLWLAEGALTPATAAVRRPADRIRRGALSESHCQPAPSVSTLRQL